MLIHRLNQEPQINLNNLSRDMRFPTMWYVRSAKSQTSLRIRED